MCIVIVVLFLKFGCVKVSFVMASPSLSSVMVIPYCHGISIPFICNGHTLLLDNSIEMIAVLPIVAEICKLANTNGYLNIFQGRQTSMCSYLSRQ